MIVVVVAVASMLLAGVDMAASTQRKALVVCLKDAQSKAKTEKIAPAGFNAYAQTACTKQMEALKAALIAIDMKNGIGRRDAAENAKMDIDGYFATADDRYKMDTEVAASPQDKPPQ